mgnify:CR=1 FL=1
MSGMSQPDFERGFSAGFDAGLLSGVGQALDLAADEAMLVTGWGDQIRLPILALGKLSEEEIDSRLTRIRGGVEEWLKHHTA